MNTEEIEFRATATAAGNVYKASFGDCDIELSEDKQGLQVISAGGHETWESNGDGVWIFIEGSRGQEPTMHWTYAHYEAVEAAVAAL